MKQTGPYLNGLPRELGPSCSALKRPGLVESDETFVVLKSHSGCDSRTGWASVHLKTRSHSLTLTLKQTIGVYSF